MSSRFRVLRLRMYVRICMYVWSSSRRGTLLCAPHAGGLAFFTQRLWRRRPRARWRAARGLLGIERARRAAVLAAVWSCPVSIIVDESVRARGQAEVSADHPTDVSWPHPGAMMAGGAERGRRSCVTTQYGQVYSWPVNRMLVRVSEYVVRRGRGTGSVRFQSARRSGGGAGAPVVSRLQSILPGSRHTGSDIGALPLEQECRPVFLPDGVQLDERCGCCFGTMLRRRASAVTKCSRISNFVQTL
jgi:hypothetical protein